ncbi:poly(A)-specific ribonuclease PARN-like protein, partial [Tanacetum coccineum]
EVLDLQLVLLCRDKNEVCLLCEGILKQIPAFDFFCASLETISAIEDTWERFNFHLFPRDELEIGMPYYSFSYQPSYLTLMAREDFDFNVCIYDGMSYLSKAQESSAKRQIENPVSSGLVISRLLSRDMLLLVHVKDEDGRFKFLE